MSRTVEQSQQHDLLRCTVPNVALPQFLEVVSGWDGDSAVVSYKGQILRLSALPGEPGKLRSTALGEC